MQQDQIEFANALAAFHFPMFVAACDAITKNTQCSVQMSNQGSSGKKNYEQFIKSESHDCKV